MGVLLLFLLPLSPFIALAFLWANLQDARLVRRFRARWPGRRGLVIYSNSPHWQAFVEERWLPSLSERAVVLNWSERATWAARHPLEHRLFERFAGSREFNPLAIVFAAPVSASRSPPGEADGAGRGEEHQAGTALRWAVGKVFFREREVRVVRFWRAFRDYRHGRPARLRDAERELFEAFGMAPPGELPAREQDR